jgi:hypothetical protein
MYLFCFVKWEQERQYSQHPPLFPLFPFLLFCFTAVGDGWNEEDLSIFSYDQQADPFNVHSGGRGLPAIVRPYASRISGVPISMKFRAEKKLFTFTYDSSQNDKCKRTFYSRLDVFFA